MTPFPYAWACTQRAMLTVRPNGVTLSYSALISQWALAEAQRCYPTAAMREVPDDELETLLAAGYSQAGDTATVMGVAESEIDLDRLMQDMPEIEDLLETQDDTPIIPIINALFTQAARDGTSDIHIEVFETHSVVRYRVDGTLRDVVSPRRALHNALISRIKSASRSCSVDKEAGRLQLEKLGMARPTCCPSWTG